MMNYHFKCPKTKHDMSTEMCQARKDRKVRGCGSCQHPQAVEKKKRLARVKHFANALDKLHADAFSDFKGETDIVAGIISTAIQKINQLHDKLEKRRTLP